MATVATLTTLLTAIPPESSDTASVLRLRLTDRANELHRNREQLGQHGIQPTWSQSLYNLIPTAPWAEEIELGTELEGPATEEETERNMVRRTIIKTGSSRRAKKCILERLCMELIFVRETRF